MLGVFWPATYLSDVQWLSFGQGTRKSVYGTHFQGVSPYLGQETRNLYVMELLSIYSRANRTVFLTAGVTLIVVIAIIDAITPPLPLGYFYLFPILLMAGFLPRLWIAFLVLLCAGLTVLMSRYELKPAIILFVMSSLGFAGTGLFVSEIVLNRQGRLSMSMNWKRRSGCDTKRKGS